MQEGNVMHRKWTRERIIRQILQCEAEGLPLTVGEPGISHALYQAGSRIFGSWRNAIQAAGIPLERGRYGEKWPPGRILTIIRNLARRHHPLNVKELEGRYGSMLSAARRLFGSWSKAVLAAGVDPTKLRRVVPWNRERVIEAILTRALRNESLSAQSIQPRSMVEAGRKFFGSWAAALETAGLDPKAIAVRRIVPPSHTPVPDLATGAEPIHRRGKPWTKEAIIASIHARLRQQMPLNGNALYRDDTALYLAAKRRFGNWSNALLSAGLNPDDHRRVGKPKHRLETPGTVQESAGTSHIDDAMRPDDPA
jgi:hypothetical protein